jgi:Fe-S cluster assembly protein SufD
MMSRGIPRPEAMALLVRAFLAEAIEALDDTMIGQALESRIATWLEARER